MSDYLLAFYDAHKFLSLLLVSGLLLLLILLDNWFTALIREVREEEQTEQEKRTETGA